MKRDELCKSIYEVAHLNGTFKLRSGQISNEYFDKYLFESNPVILREIAKHLVEQVPEGTEILAGLEMGGIPIATALSIETGIPVVFVRKKAKEYGTCKLAEGTDFRNKKVCIIEDVVTTGGQILLSAEDLRGFGAKLENVLCVIERNPEGRKKLRESGLELKALFTMAELKEHE
ncbi:MULTISPECIES: orotate phosphoribosyltransferase [unclassified Clostridium]|uniref:orotate phosphoribosyltransferase n=1 Tax=unclassified Clostridium TaxID=2614128 RepID=UPI00023B01EE|nr:MULTISPECIES: orotate phosphoribosyltransferase [unclassified Clostridium]EHI99246.1 Orotate phosphoribosyltransferase [Clostridium sp. DL-VIII]OOM78595.1 orotate phosphoribosyltransferase [Clostridium sp. BL-8]